MLCWIAVVYHTYCRYLATTNLRRDQYNNHVSCLANFAIDAVSAAQVRIRLAWFELESGMHFDSPGVLKHSAGDSHRWVRSWKGLHCGEGWNSLRQCWWDCTCRRIQQCTHPPAQSLTHTLTHSLALSLTHSLSLTTHSHTDPLTHSIEVLKLVIRMFLSRFALFRLTLTPYVLAVASVIGQRTKK
jgi:hypothetical protein